MTPGVITLPDSFGNRLSSTEQAVAASRVLRRILMDPRIDLGVLNVAPSALQLWDRLPVSVSAFPSSSTRSASVHAMRRIVEISETAVILDADDENTARLSAYTELERVCYVTRSSPNQEVRDHIQAGRAACVLEHRHLIAMYSAGAEIAFPMRTSGPTGDTEDELMGKLFAAAVAFSLGLQPSSILEGLNNFENRHAD